MFITTCVTIFLCVLKFALSIEKTSMYMKRAEVNDQKMSGSGYAFNLNAEKPETYAFEVDGDGGGGGGDEVLRMLRDLGYDPFNSNLEGQTFPTTLEESFPNAAKIPDFQPVTFPAVESISLEPKYIPVPFELPFQNVAKVPEVKAAVTFPAPTVIKVENPASAPQVKQFNNLGTYSKYPYATGYDQSNEKFKKSDGNTYKDITSSKTGNSVDKSYNIVDAYAKGLKGKYDNKAEKSYYDHSAAKKAAGFGLGGNYNVKAAKGAVSGGGSFDQNNSHDNGSKTTGYHKVYHKDDYNKQHKFYDKADRRGTFVKYGDSKATNDKTEGEYIRGANEDSGDSNSNWKNSDTSDKGHNDESSKGFKKVAGQAGYYKNNSEYSAKAGKDNNQSSNGYNR